MPSPLQKRSKDYKGLHWCQNPAEDLFGLSASLLASLCSDSSLRSCYFGPEEIFKEYGFMWGTKPKKVLCWVLAPLQCLDLFCNGDGNEHLENTLCSCFVTDSCTFCVCLEMVEKADFNVEDQINYEAETGEGSEGEVFAMLNYS